MNGFLILQPIVSGPVTHHRMQNCREGCTASATSSTTTIMTTTTTTTTNTTNTTNPPKDYMIEKTYHLAPYLGPLGAYLTQQ